MSFIQPPAGNVGLPLGRVNMKALTRVTPVIMTRPRNPRGKLRKRDQNQPDRELLHEVGRQGSESAPFSHSHEPEGGSRAAKGPAFASGARNQARRKIVYPILILRRRSPANPTRPVPNRPSVPGSGTERLVSPLSRATEPLKYPFPVLTVSCDVPPTCPLESTMAPISV